jgi:hypothetical protein
MTTGLFKVMDLGMSLPFIKAPHEGCIVRESAEAIGSCDVGVTLIPCSLMPNDGLKKRF